MTSAQELALDEDWTEKFIKTISRKPALYDKDAPEYANKNIVSDSWTDVCEEMLPNWGEMTQAEQTLKAKEILQRWRNLKTCFKRELNKQSHLKTAKSGIKRRKYIYFDQLSFLLPTLEGWKATKEFSPLQTIKVENAKDTPTQQLVQPPPKRSHKRKPSSTENKNTAKLTFEAPPPPPLPPLNISPKIKPGDEIDEDKTFLMSLVPSLRRMNASQKIEAKMEFLSTIKRITQPTPSCFTPTLPKSLQETHSFDPNYSQHIFHTPSAYIQSMYAPSQSTPLPLASPTPTPSGSVSSASPSSEVLSSPTSEEL